MSQAWKLRTLDELRDAFINPESGELDEVAWINSLRTRLTNSIDIPEQQLQELGEARRQAIVDEATTRGLDATRIRSVDENKADATADGRVQIELGLEAA